MSYSWCFRCFRSLSDPSTCTTNFTDQLPEIKFLGPGNQKFRTFLEDPGRGPDPQLLSQDSPKIPKSHLKWPQNLNNVETWWNLISKPINSSSMLKSSRGNIFFCGDRTKCRWVRAESIFEKQKIKKKSQVPDPGRAINFSLDMHVGVRSIYKDQTWNFKSKFRKLGVCRNSLLGCLVTYCWLPISMRRLLGGHKATQRFVEGSLEFTLAGLLHHLIPTFGKLKRVWVGRIRPIQISLMRFRINTLWVTILFELSAPGFADPSHLRVWVQGCSQWSLCN